MIFNEKDGYLNWIYEILCGLNYIHIEIDESNEDYEIYVLTKACQFLNSKNDGVIIDYERLGIRGFRQVDYCSAGDTTTIIMFENETTKEIAKRLSLYK